MASKSSFGRSKNDKFLTYTIIGFAGVVVALVVGLILYDIFTVELSYTDFDGVTNFNQIRNQTEDEYIVYYYSESCGFCNQIKNAVMNFADENDENIKVYMMDAQVAYSTAFPIFDPDSGDEMTGTPSMITVVNGEIVHMAGGYLEVLDLIEAIDDGTYAYLD